jgi:Predicted nucleotidyltransferase.
MNYTQWFSQNGKFQKHEQWLVDNLLLESIVGSHAYGCQTESSDTDIMAIVLPKHEHLYPQKYGFVLGFDNLPKFERKELKGKQKTLIEGKPVKAEWVSLLEFFYQAGLKGSPNLIECLFVRRNLVTVGTKMGWYLRDQRRLFLSMRTFFAFKGYANGQMHRIRQRNPETEERKALVKKHGFDTKMAYHTLRLLDQLEQILTTNDIDLMRNKEEHKLMRSGEWGDFDRFDKEFQRRMDHVSELSTRCNLPQQPQNGALKKLLNEILEEHYSENSDIKQDDEYVSVKDINAKFNLILERLNERAR